MTTSMTLAERRAALKRLLAAGESAIDAYERVLEGGLGEGSALSCQVRALRAPRPASRRVGVGRSPRGHGAHVRFSARRPGRERRRRR